MAVSERGDQSKCHLDWSGLARWRPSMRGRNPCSHRLEETTNPSAFIGQRGVGSWDWGLQDRAVSRKQNQQTTCGRILARSEAARVPSGRDLLRVPATPAFSAWQASETSFHLFQKTEEAARNRGTYDSEGPKACGPSLRYLQPSSAGNSTWTRVHYRSDPAHFLSAPIGGKRPRQECSLQ